jgi:uncharacterized membrane protein
MKDIAFRNDFSGRKFLLIILQRGFRNALAQDAMKLELNFLELIISMEEEIKKGKSIPIHIVGLNRITFLLDLESSVIIVISLWDSMDIALILKVS